MGRTPNTERLALGVDGGGSKVDAVLVDESGNVLGWGRGGSAHSLYVGAQTAVQSYEEALQSALAGHKPRTLCIAGLNRRLAGFMTIENAQIVHVGEQSMGLAMALQTHGLLVLAGTGAFVAGLTEDGRYLHFDGMGPVLGDHGSGYQIGLMGIRAVAASSWSSERKTVLAHTVPQALGVTSLHEIFDLVYAQHIGRSRIASAAKAVIRAAEDGDAVAAKIVLAAADDIAEVLLDVIRGLGIENSDYALVASGGVAQRSKMYWGRICERALEVAPHLKPIQPAIRPCVGAALIALKAMGVPWSQELLSRIEETQKPYLESI